MDPRVLGMLLCDEQITVETDQPLFIYQSPARCVECYQLFQFHFAHHTETADVTAI